MKIYNKEMSTSIKKIIALSIMSTMGVVTVFSVGVFTKNVTIYDGNKKISTFSVSSDVNKILENAGIAVNSVDYVEVNNNDDNNSINISISRPFNVFIDNNGKKTTLKMCKGTVADALKLANIENTDNIYVEPNLNFAVTPDMKIKIHPKITVNITKGNESQELYLTKCTVGEALNLSQICLDENDILNVDKSAEITENMRINVDKKEFSEEIINTEIPFETVTQTTDTLYQGQTKIAVNGKNGIRTTKLRHTLINGSVTDTQELENSVTQQPVNKVILIGNKAQTFDNKIENFSSSAENVSTVATTTDSENFFVDNKGNKVKYTKKLQGSGTAYTAHKGAHTSTGKIPVRGMVAVNPKKIPYGTKLYIKATNGSYDYGYAVAADTGGALKNGSAIVDLYMDSNKECYNFGRRKVDVYVLS